jgi:hypothetical protein
MQSFMHNYVLESFPEAKPIICISNSNNNQNNVILGHNSYQAIAKNYTDCTILGSNANCTGNSQVQLGSTISNTYSYANIQNISDARDKAYIRDTVLGLDFIAQLRPVDYRWNYREDYVVPTGEYETINHVKVPITITLPNDGSKTRTRFHHGFIAQEVKQTMDSLGIDFGGYQDHTVKGGQEKLSISYTELIAPLVRSIQELKVQLNMVSAQVETLQYQIDSVNKTVNTGNTSNTSNTSNSTT